MKTIEWRRTRILLLAVVLASCGGGGSIATPEPTEVTPTTAELTLLGGMRLDLAERCRPLREDLPEGAIAGLECAPADTAIGVAQVYLFNTVDEMLARYVALLAEAGVEPRTEGSGLAFGEAAYVPGDDPGGPLTETRHGHFVDPTGHGHYLATQPPFVLLAVTGTDANVDALYDWAWRGNQDVPGAPTLWRESPVNPEGKG
jgi:hypothetical protein